MWSPVRNSCTSDDEADMIRSLGAVANHPGRMGTIALRSADSASRLTAANRLPLLLLQRRHPQVDAVLPASLRCVRQLPLRFDPLHVEIVRHDPAARLEL